jgi:glycosyltransferase involved in cell wall biosynthesis
MGAAATFLRAMTEIAKLTSEPEVSVIIPTFKRPAELAEAISSVLTQHEVKVEILVVDDCPEGSAELVVRNRADPRVAYLKNPKPSEGVPSQVRNMGWPKARGNYVHFLDDDDRVADGHYEAVKAAFAANPKIGLVFGRVEPFANVASAQLEHEHQYFADAARKAAICGRFGSRLAFTGRMLFDKALLVCSASVIRRRCLEQLGGFDPEIRLMEDADYHLRAMREYGAIFIDRPAVHYRIGSPSLMHSLNPTAEQREGERLGHRQMQTKYSKQHGVLEFYALALFTRTVLKIY